MKYQIERLKILEDWIEIIKDEMTNEGYSITDTDPDEVSLQYFNLKKRIIKPIPRKILKSNVFICPADLIVGLAGLETKISKGENLKPYLSRKLKNLTDGDTLLNDWGIFHLHLGTYVEGDGYINRTGPLLFARFDNQNAYLINIMVHGAWTQQQMLKVIHDNWPESIETFKLIGVIGVAHKVTDQEVGKLRKASVNTMIEIEPGVVYIGPGGGFVSSGHSTDVIMKHMKIKQKIKQLQKHFETYLDQVTEQCFTDVKFIENINFNFKLVREDGKYYLNELNNKFSIIIGDEIN